MRKAWIIGHRGAAGFPENTVPAFENAVALGVDAIELDVRRSGDDKLVVVHDAVVGEHAVKSTPYETFRQLPDGHEVPLFEDVIKQFGRKIYLNIELKDEELEEEAVALIKKYSKSGKAMVSGFDVGSLLKVHELSGDIELGYIYNKTQDEESRHQAPIDVVIPQFRLAARELIEAVHSEGLKVWAWTVNEELEIERLLRLGVDGLITDYPERVAAALAK
jgi:glycerophosphoryl diester phosphodiesterase